MDFSSMGFIPSIKRSVMLGVYSFDAEFKRPSTQFAPSIKRLVVLSTLSLVIPIHVCYQHFGYFLDSILYRDLYQIPVIRPVFVVSNARSGSTLLQRLLFSHPDTFMSISVWEMLFAQSVTYRRIFQILGRLDRYLCFGLVTKMVTRLDSALLRYSTANLPHPVSLLGPDEDEWAMISFGGAQLAGLLFPLLDARTPLTRLVDFDDNLSRSEQVSLFNAYRLLLKRHIYFETRYRGASQSRRYLAKNPTFTLRLRSLLDAFPDASVVDVVRDPHEAIPSMVSYICSFWRLFATCKVRYPFSAELQSMCAKHYTYPLRIHAERPFVPFVSLRYEDLKADPTRTIQRVLKELHVASADQFVHLIDNQAVFQHHHSVHGTLGMSLQEFQDRHKEVFSLYPEYLHKQ